MSERLISNLATQCSGSVTLWYGSGLTIWSGSGSFRQWPKLFCLLLFKAKFTLFFTDKKSLRSHKTLCIKVFLTIFAGWWKDPDPDPNPDTDPYLWLTNPDPTLGYFYLFTIQVLVMSQQVFSAVSIETHQWKWFYQYNFHFLGSTFFNFEKFSTETDKTACRDIANRWLWK